MPSSVQSLRLSGEIDVAYKEEFAKLLQPLETADVVILDFEAVSFFDSSAISCLIVLHRRVQNNGTKAAIRIVKPGSGIRRVLEVTGLTSLFSLYETRSEALRNCHILDGESLEATLAEGLPVSRFSDIAYHFGTPIAPQGA